MAGKQSDEAARPRSITPQAEADIRRRFDALLQAWRYAELITAAEALGPLEPSYADLRDTVVGHARLALAYDREAEIAAARERERSRRWLTPESLLARIENAIRAREPFAFIRLGDGEARFTVTMTAELRPGLSLSEIQAISRPVWELRFHERIDDVDARDLSGLMADYCQAIRVADALGVTNAERLSSKPNIFGYLAAQETWLRRHLLERPDILFTDAVAHFRLDDLSPFFESLLRGLPFLGLIGPHAELEARLASRYAIPTTQSYLVRGESLLPDAARANHPTRHFPERYHEILETLSVPYPGAVFLVAAGLLGKIYCARIKQLGGIALDVGGVADAWMGFDTRPGFRRQPVRALDGPPA